MKAPPSMLPPGSEATLTAYVPPTELSGNKLLNETFPGNEETHGRARSTGSSMVGTSLIVISSQTTSSQNCEPIVAHTVKTPGPGVPSPSVSGGVKFPVLVVPSETPSPNQMTV